MERVKILLAQEDAQRERIDAMPDQWRRDVAEAVDALREHLTGEIARVEGESLFERRWGVALLLAGVVVSTAANLI